jgi:hypothetical protein
MLAALQALPRDAELLAFEAGCEDYGEREVDEVECNSRTTGQETDMSARLPTVIRGNGSHGVGGRASELPIITIRSRPTRGVAPGSVGGRQRLVGAADGRRPRLECFVD